MGISIVNEKKFWQSKTFWLGIIQVVIGVLTSVEGELTTGGTLTLSGIVTIVLRSVTKTQIKI